MSDPKSILPSDYPGFLAEIKKRISRERVRAALSANSAMILLYWDLGRSILSRQGEQGWGSKAIEQLARDLKAAFPGMTGFSVRNLRNMRMFARSWPDKAIVLRFVAQLPWGTNLSLLNKLRDPDLRLWYAQRAIEDGFTRDMLVFQIESQLHRRQGLSQHNFPSTMPSADSDLAAEVFKDPYLFDFLGTDAPRREAELEQRLVDHIQRFLLELGQGFAFVGRQVELKVGEREFRIDLLFYHLKLRCFVVVELKAGRFEPEYVGKLNMYLNAVDELKAHADDNPSIGLLLVKEKDQLVVEYALGGTRKPMGVAQWERQITKSLPEEWKSSLPTVEEIEAELQ
jgi:predicted nuclease of restriction endonuclease-like (RecB) superfamily